MRIYRTEKGIVVEDQGQYFLAKESNWDAFVNRSQLHKKVSEEIATLTADASLEPTTPLAPIGNQEIWASGVTYLRSMAARMEESKEAGGGTFYDRVYTADRPELFFKAASYRTVGPGDNVRIRRDSKWNVPEPELTLFICSEGSIEGYTCGNDMSSRDIEGENPLYLPQAKSYNGAAAIGPCLFVPEAPISQETTISLKIGRNGKTEFSDSIAINQMKRKHTELVGYLFREMDFPNGAFLMTGTGIIPHDDFTLQVGDVVSITIEGIGTLTNTVTQ